MPQSIYIRSRELKFAFIICAVALIGAGIYWFLDQYIVNPDVSFKNIDVSSRQVSFTNAPPFVLPDLAGQPVDISTYQDKVVIVNFWASWCAPCIEEFSSLYKYGDLYKNEVVLLAISQDNSIDDAQSFLNKFKVEPNPSFHVLLDLDKRIGRIYDVKALPESFIFSRNLKFERKIVGYRDWLSPSSLAEIKKIIETAPQ